MLHATRTRTNAFTPRAAMCMPAPAMCCMSAGLTSGCQL